MARKLIPLIGTVLWIAGCGQTAVAPAQPAAQPVPTATAVGERAAPAAKEAPIFTCHAPRLDVLYRARWKCPDGHVQLDEAQAEQVRQRLGKQKRPAALAGNGAFSPPPVGTRLYISTGGFYEILAIEGMTISLQAPNGSLLVLFAGVYFPWIDSDFDREKLESLWPLEAGKKVEIVQVRDRQSWRNEFRVVGQEKIKTMAGEFDTYLIEIQSEGLSGDSTNRYSLTRKLWYSPATGYIVKSDFEQRSGTPANEKPWELARAVRP